MQYEKKDFSRLMNMDGFSAKSLETHFALYEGYVNNANKLLEAVKGLGESGKSDTPQYAEQKRRLGWEFNGMRLHELYFGNLGQGGKMEECEKLRRAMEENFGSVEAWKNDFISTGKMRGIGWVILYHDKSDGAMFNFWINEHDCGHPAGLNPILVMDVFEHAYMLDYGKDKPSYLEAFMKNVNWNEAEKRMG